MGESHVKHGIFCHVGKKNPCGKKKSHVDMGFFSKRHVGKKSHVDMRFSHVNMRFFSQHGVLKKSHVNMEHLFLMGGARCRQQAEMPTAWLSGPSDFSCQGLLTSDPCTAP